MDGNMSLTGHKISRRPVFTFLGAVGGSLLVGGTIVQFDRMQASNEYADAVDDPATGAVQAAMTSAEGADVYVRQDGLTQRTARRPIRTVPSSSRRTRSTRSRSP